MLCFNYDIKSKVLVNGFFTEMINVSRSVRQGCSLSPLLYVLCIEPLANVINMDNHVSGFTITVVKILNIYELYGLVSG